MTDCYSNTDPTSPLRGKIDQRLRGFLLSPINPNRVQEHKGHSHLAAWDVRRALIWCFGFGGYSTETRELTCIHESSPGPGRFTVSYRAQVRLIVRDKDGHTIGWWDDVAVGGATNQPGAEAAHDLAVKSALSGALKRAAVNLGDQFGLSLYNAGSLLPVVRRAIPYLENNTTAADADAEPVKGDTDPTTTSGDAPDTGEAPAREQVTEAEASQRDFLEEARQAATREEAEAIRNAAAAGGAPGYVLELARIASTKPPTVTTPSVKEEAEALAARFGLTLNQLSQAAVEALGVPLDRAAEDVARKWLASVATT
ncbi:Rad52/Rad22 family DNA repair protein [Streptomyces chilikensis]|uniref:Rad52/Rad22 family DNA repair protein n=1 Tax=Streptomyces chilikensis TaxID=1194079 RepID=A0ABV3EJ72_9ACTN